MAFLAGLEIVLVRGDTLIDVTLMREEVVESGLETGDLFSLLLTDCAAVCDFLQREKKKKKMQIRTRERSAQNREERREKQTRATSWTKLS